MQKIAILYDASQAVLSTFDLDEVLEHILRILRDYFQLEHSAILLLDPTTGELDPRSVSTSSSGKLKPVRIGEGLIGTAAKAKRPIYSRDVSQDLRYICSFPSTRSELAIPLMLRDEVVGVLDCQSDRLSFFDNETTDLLMLFSTQASIAIQNAQLYALEQRRAKHLEAINTIARQTTAVTDIRRLLDKVAAQITESFRTDEVSILLLDSGRLVPRAYHGTLTPLFPLGDPLARVSPICQHAVSTNMPVLVEDVSKAPDYLPIFDETRSQLVLPLISFGQTIGVLTLESATCYGISSEDAKPLESVADICAAAIQNAYYFDRVKQLAYRDGLTGVFNRRFFDNRMAEEIERSERHCNPLSVLLVDIDSFKSLNDEFGHLLGDEVLKQVSNIFLMQTRKSDVVCRYGGDELAVLLPQTVGTNALIVAEKLRCAVAEWDFPGAARSVTLSIGVAQFPIHGASRDELIKSADNALYAAKQAGRNRCVLCPEAVSVSD
jgi:diguanylate cyclase (GGDEF)-like protein